MMFEGNTMVFGGQNSLMSMAVVHNQFLCWEAQCLFSGVAEMARKLSAMNLTHVEVALFCAVVILLGESFLLMVLNFDLVQIASKY